MPEILKSSDLDLLPLHLEDNLYVQCLREANIESAEEEQQIVNLFNNVRDIPFEAVKYKKKMTYKDIIAYTRLTRRGACSAKHYLLGSEYENLDINTIYISYPFYWQDMEIDYPKHIKELAEIMPMQYHLALGIVIDDTPYFLDATWDPDLEHVGFEVNDIGDGIKQTAPAVPPAGEPISHNSGQERWDFIEEIKRSMESTSRVVPQFYSDLNEWLEGLRANKQ